MRYAAMFGSFLAVGRLVLSVMCPLNASESCDMALGSLMVVLVGWPRVWIQWYLVTSQQRPLCLTDDATELCLWSTVPHGEWPSCVSSFELATAPSASIPHQAHVTYVGVLGLHGPKSRRAPSFSLN